MKLQLFGRLVLFLPLFMLAVKSPAFGSPTPAPLPNFDKRADGLPAGDVVLGTQRSAVEQLRASLPRVQVDFEPVTGAPKFVAAGNQFLSGANGQGKAVSAAAAASFAGDPHQATKAFLQEHRQLFGYGPEVLDQARVKREFVTPHNGLKTVVWEQQVDGIPLFEAVLISHTTRQGELVNLGSQFVAEPDQAADRGTPNRAVVETAPNVSARQAVALATQNLGDELKVEQVAPSGQPEPGVEQKQMFIAPPLRGESEAKLIWLPMDKQNLRLCWDVILTSRARDEMFRILVDAQTGEVLVRHCLTDYLSDASYRVFTSDSPSPFSPGYATPVTSQPPLVSRTLITLPALDTNASPAGWINDGDNQTLGNNVDAHTDWNNDNSPDLPRPQGSPFRVFDFSMNLATQDPTNYAAAAVVQLFYWNNFMHDKLYELGFTEAAGNFQSNNFGRGGLGNDAVQADAQDGGGTDNANFSTPPDGSAPRMQMYIFTGPSPRRDGDLDAEVVLHEYTHGLSNRRVGGGVGISALQSAGMGEGWSDFYALSLLSEAGDDVNGNYAAGAYASYKIGGASDLQNYYFGIRRYPYTTDMTKNPLTLKDIDPAQADYCSSPAPYHTGMFGTCSTASANEVHNQGEVWCVTLWEARAALINKYGWATGNQLILQLVTDGMNLSPANPNFLQARDAIIQADMVDTGGANQHELWAAFAKRGMGFTATSPSSSTTTGVHEAYDIPDDLRIIPGTGFSGSGPVGGPFTPNSVTFALTNTGSNSLNWTLVNTSSWLNVFPAGGTLTPGGLGVSVTAGLDAAVGSLPMGIYSATVWFTNLNSQVVQNRQFTLRVGQPDYFTELFDTSVNDLAFQTFTFTPDGSGSFYAACREAATSFPTDPTGGTAVAMSDDTYAQVTLSGTNTVAIYGRRTNIFYIGSNGYLTMDSGDTTYVESYVAHFNRPRVSALFDDLYPSTGQVTWKQMSNRVAVTYLNVPEYGATTSNSFQIEMFYDGRIRLTYLGLAALDGLAGLSAGTGVPTGFTESDLTSYGSCSLPLFVVVPPSATEGDGVLAGAGQVRLPAALATDLTVALSSSDTTEVTVPANVTILAGQTNAAFDLTIVDDGVLDGTQTTAITASASGYTTGSANIAVFDNETATLGVVLPATATEGQGTVTGAVQVVGGIPAANITVNLSSSDTTEIQVPASVIIPSGQTSAVFTATVVTDNELEGPQTVAVTAHVQNWTDGMTTIEVLNNKSWNLTVTLPASAWENAGVLTNAGSVSISGTLPTDLAVSLVSGTPAKLTVPSSVTISAGQVSSTFNLTLVDNSVPDGHQTVTVTASAPSFTNGLASIYVIDDESPPPPSNPRPGNLAVNVPANTNLMWNNGTSGSNELIINGGFEAGTFTNWLKQNIGSSGDFIINNGSYDPPGPGVPMPPFAGSFSAESEQTGGGSHVIYQDITLPSAVSSATLTWTDCIRNFGLSFNNTNQYFHVEIRGTNDSLIQVAFTTNPGDPLTNNWVTRSFNLSPYIGQTIRIAFLETDHLGYFNLHLDNVSVQVNTPTGSGSITNDVYFGTNPTPGPAEYQGSTTNSSWTLPLLSPLMTYYWQIVANKGGTATGPVWQFTTRGVDHFVWDAVSSPQFVNQPFGTTITAKDAFNVTVSNFTGRVGLSGWGDCSRLGQLVTFDDLSGSGLPVPVGYYGLTWSNFSYLVGANLTNSGYSAGTVSPPNVAYNANGTPASVISTGQVNFVSAYLTAAWNDNLQVQVNGYTGATLVYSNSYTLSATASTLINFNYLGVTKVDFISSGGTPHPGYSGSGTHFAMDNVVIGGSASSPVSITPTNSGNFVNGAWTGNIIVLQPATNVVLRADDGSGHTGSSNPFDVIVQNDLLLVSPSDGLVSQGYEGGPFNPSNKVYTLSNRGTNALDWSASCPQAWVPVLTNTSPDAVRAIVINSPQSCRFFRAVAPTGGAQPVLSAPSYAAGQVQFTLSGQTNATYIIEASTDLQAKTWWMTVDPSGGSLAPGASTNVTVLINTNACNLSNGVYTATAAFHNLMSGVAQGRPVTLTVLTLAPTIVTQPTNQTVVVGGTANFNVVALGSTPLFYQWCFNGTNMVGATNTTLTLTNVQPAQAGSYTVLVTNVHGSILSSNAVLTVLDEGGVLATTFADDNGFAGNMFDIMPKANLGITALDVNVSSTETGQVATVTVFYRNGSSFGHESDSAGWTLLGTRTVTAAGQGVPTHVDISDNGVQFLQGQTYGLYVYVDYDSGAFMHYTDGTNTYEDAVIRLITNCGKGTPPFTGSTFSPRIWNGAIYYATGPVPGTAPAFTSQPANQTVPVGSAASFNVTVSGSAPLSYQWNFNRTNIVGATNTILTLTNMQFSQAGNYAVMVTNAYGSVLSSNAVLTVVPGTAPAITSQPSSQSVPVGNSVTFSVGATGTAPLSYFWRRNGTPIAGANSSGYTTNNVQLADSGALFSCLVSNAFGTALSSNATLIVTVPSGPVFLNGSYLYLPIATNGVFIAASTGGKFNSAGTGGNFGVDFWWPGTPVYNYVVGMGGTNYADGNFRSITVSNLSSGGLQRALIDAMIVTNLHFTRDISFAVDSKAIRIVDTLQNYGSSTLSNLVTLDSTDPDQDYTAVPSTFSTLNDVVSVNLLNDMVVATGPSTGLSLGFGSDSSMQVPSAIGFNNTNAYAYLTVVDPDGASGDIAINLVQNYGSLGSGQSKSVVWYMVFDVSKAAVTNAFATLGSTNSPPFFTSQPVSQTVSFGDTAIFSVTVSGTPPLSYFWRRNGVSIPGANGASYSLTNAQMSDSGTLFSCLVSNVAGSVVSSNALLKVIETVANDLCSGAIVISSSTYTNTQSTIAATSIGDPVPDCVPGFGNGVWYQFTPPVSGLLIVDTFDSDFDTGLAAYTGSCNSLTEAACNDDTDGVTSQIILPVTGGVTYYLLAGGYSAHTGNLVFHLTFLTPPVITTQPTNQTVTVGGTATFSVTASGTQPLSYQWGFNGTNISGATNTSLTLTNIQLNQSGNYAVLVTNLYGSILSSNAVLTVNLSSSCDPAPSGLVAMWQAEGNANDSIGTNNGAMINGTTFVTGEVGQAFSLSGANYVSVPDAPALNPTNAITIECWLYRQAYIGSYDTVVKKAGTVGGGTANGYSLEFNGSSLFFWLYNGGWHSSGGTVPIQLGQWYHIAGVYDGAHIMVYINGQLAASASASGNIVPSVNALRMGSDPADPSRSFKGSVDEVSIYNRALSLSEIAAIYSAGSAGKCFTPVPPTITTQPTNQTVVVVGTATFSVTASGTPPLRYLWSFNGTNIAGATNTTLTLTNAQLNQAGNYAVLVTNLYGSILSSNAALTMNPAVPPSIISQPTNQTVFAGNTASFSVAASGTSPLSYQWNFNGTNIAGATNTTLTLTNVQLNQAGNYAALVTNLGGSILSSNATLAVRVVPPAITQQPTNQTTCVGGTATFSVVASGAPPLSYQWSFSGTNIVGATNTTLTLTNVQFNQAGNYTVLVTNLYGSILSSNALLTVNPPPSCDPAPSGLVAWWPGEGNGNDIVGANNGTLTGGVGFAAGEVGQAFLFNTTNGGITVPASGSLNVGTNGGLTMEAWIYPTALTNTAQWLLGWKAGSSYGAMLKVSQQPSSGQGTGCLFANVIDVSGNNHYFSSAAGILQNNVFQHVALTYNQGSGVATIYCNGVIVAQQSLGSFTARTSYPFVMGATASVPPEHAFSGLLDEVSVYNRALASNEIAAIYNASGGGKCTPLSLPVITQQPTNQTVFAGNTASFSVAASGTWPLSYQWSFNGTNIAGATNTTLTLTNVQFMQAGSYAVLVTNAAGSILSSNALLTVFPPLLVQNGGFELGTFDYWTTSGNFDCCFVNSDYVHSGVYGAEVGPMGTPGYISQTLATTVGQMYLVSCWLYCDGETPNEFSVSWKGTILFDQQNIGATFWTNLQFQASATATNTVLTLGFRDDPSFLGLDDITVYPMSDNSPLQFQTMTLINGTLSLGWSAQAGQLYQVQYTTNLAQIHWVNLGGVLSTANSSIMATDDTTASTTRFYRIVLLPAALPPDSH